MAEFIFRGTVTLDGVDFFIEADDLGAAKARAKAGDYDRREDNGAAVVDWHIDAETGQANE